MSVLDDFRLEPSDLRAVGHELSRPECIIAERNGTLWISDDRGGVTRIDPSGAQTLVGSLPGKPNGIALDADGSFLVAEIENGVLYRLRRDGSSEIVLDALGGRPLGALNFVMVDGERRIWATVSTRTKPRSQAIGDPRPDGYAVLVDERGSRIVGEGFHFTNEIRIDRAGRFAYLAETALGRVVRMAIRDDLSLAGPAEVFGPARLFDGALIDGITFDSAGNLWVTEITRNALAVIDPNGRSRIVYEEPSGTVLKMPTSITFGGHDLRTAYVGSLTMDHIVRFRSPVAGEPLPHW